MRRRRAIGFTLVEVVVALTLVSLIMLALLAALRAFGDAGARLEARSARDDDMRLVSAFLRQALSEPSGKHLRRLPDGSVAGFFQGDAHALEWLAPMPARYGVGGLHRLRLALRGRELVLQFVPFVPSADSIFDWSAAPAKVLATEVDELAIQYQGLGARRWERTWHEAMVLPARVRLQIAAGGRPWPDLVAAVVAAEEGEGVATRPFD